MSFTIKRLYFHNTLYQFGQRFGFGQHFGNIKYYCQLSSIIDRPLVYEGGYEIWGSVMAMNWDSESAVLPLY